MSQESPGERRLRRLIDVGRGLVSEHDLEAVLNSVLEVARELTGARYAALGILDERKHELERFLYVGIDEETRRAIGPLPRGRGVLGELIRNPKPLRLSQVTDHPRSYGFPPGHPPMTSFLGMPIQIRGEAYGNLYLADKEGGAEFDDADEQSALVLSEWAAIAIDNARLYEGVERRRAELERAVRGLEATTAIAQAVGGETELERVLELIVKRGRALVNARTLLILLADKDVLRVAQVAGEIRSDAIGQTIPAVGTLAGTVLETRATELVPELASRVGHGLAGLTRGAGSAIAVPLSFRSRGRGVLLALDRSDGESPLGQDDADLLTSFAASASIAIATAQSVEADRLGRSIEAAEQERRRWARELHDETLQELGALKMVLSTAGLASEERLRSGVARALEQIDLSIRNLQALITELRPSSLDELGVQPALEALVKRTAALSGLEIELELGLAEGAEAGGRLSPQLEGTVYRLVQEALNNVVKHAQAERVSVALGEEAGRVTVAVSDDGVGFDPTHAGDGFGLLGMRERVALVGGELLIDSAPGAGTSLRASAPAERAAGAPSDRRRAG